MSAFTQSLQDFDKFPENLIHDSSFKYKRRQLAEELENPKTRLFKTELNGTNIKCWDFIKGDAGELRARLVNYVTRDQLLF